MKEGKGAGGNCEGVIGGMEEGRTEVKRVKENLFLPYADLKGGGGERGGNLILFLSKYDELIQ